MSIGKLSYVPQIGGLDELLALVADDHRYKQHLEAMRDLRDAVTVLLGDLDTSEKVELAYAAARLAHSEAEDVLAQTEAERMKTVEHTAELLVSAEDGRRLLELSEQHLEEKENFYAKTYSTFVGEKATWEKEKETVKEAFKEENQRLLIWDGELQEQKEALQQKVEAVNAAMG